MQYLGAANFREFIFRLNDATDGWQRTGNSRENIVNAIKLEILAKKLASIYTSLQFSFNTPAKGRGTLYFLYILIYLCSAFNKFEYFIVSIKAFS